MLQPLDVGVNCPTKAEMQRFWCDWIAEGEHTKTGRKRRGEVSVIVILICLFLFYLKNTLRKIFDCIRHTPSFGFQNE